MTIFGTDTSLYQAPGTYSPGSFEIINALDPTLPTKVERNRAENRPWGIYSWVFPGEHGSYTVGRAINAASKVGGSGPLGFWWDYEDNGVVQSQLDEAFATSDAEGYYSGYYGNDYRFDHSTLLSRPYWMAAYPNPNDGVWRDYQATASRPVQIWQWTSTNGTLDQNVIVDEAWFQSLVGGSPPPVVPVEEEDDMAVLITSDPDQGSDTILYTGMGWRQVVPGEDQQLVDLGLLKDKNPRVVDAATMTRIRTDLPEVTPVVAGGGGAGGPLTVTLTGTAKPV